MDALENISLIPAQLAEALKNASATQIEGIKKRFLGKDSVLSLAMKSLKDKTAAEKIQWGRVINDVKKHVMAQFDEVKTSQTGKGSAHSIDVTLPGRKLGTGRLHPLSQTAMIIESYFQQLGFLSLDGPEIESSYYNFSALNTPEHHPARAMHDTFYCSDEHLLRSHTSPVQVRALEQWGAPLRGLATGRVYRRDYDATHTPMFHQIEGLWVDDRVNFSDLQGILIHFLQYLFGPDKPIRIRSSYFPFTAPSIEVDIQLGPSGSWLEVLGAGMVHPHVLTSAGVCAQQYQGFAFGMGLERLTMLREGVEDLRVFFMNDLDFLEQF